MSKGIVDRQDAICGWATCQANASNDTPLCTKHLLEAWRTVEEARATVRHLDAELPPAEPAQIRPDTLDMSAGRVKESAVYYFRAQDGLIKIGRSVDVRRRLKALLVDSAALLAIEPGDHRKEKLRHRQFAHLRIGMSEFFTPAGDLLEHIDGIVRTFGGTAALMDAQELFNLRTVAAFHESQGNS